jgi:hypothetical protein
VLWATGFRPDHSWLDIPVRDRTGRIRHDGGIITGAPGLYVLGLPVLRTRASHLHPRRRRRLRRSGGPPPHVPQQPAPMTTRRPPRVGIGMSCSTSWKPNRPDEAG